MNVTIKSEWVKALRSGNYSQCSNALRDDRGCFCALGVLCDLAVKAGIATWQASTDSHKPDRYIVVSTDGDMSDSDDHLLPQFVQRWAGIKDCDPTMYIEDTIAPYTVSELNDRLHWDFSDIAEQIDLQL